MLIIGFAAGLNAPVYPVQPVYPINVMVPNLTVDCYEEVQNNLHKIINLSEEFNTLKPDS